MDRTGPTGAPPEDGEAGQRETVAFLADATAHDGAPAEHVQTHISHVFLTDARAYKLKRAVRPNFLDFSTLEAREAACRREVAVNRPAAGDLYQGLRPVLRRRNGALALGPLLSEPDGEPNIPRGEEILDWVVAMRRFPRENELDRMARAGQLKRAHMLSLADRLAALHASAPVRRAYGGADAVRATVRQLAEALLAAPCAPRLREPLVHWRAAATAEIRRLAGRLDARRRHGFVRRCHGDLHLANICLLDGAPTPFDAIEFSEEIASIDVLYDLAFPVMDLIDHELPELAGVLTSRYLGATRDYSGAAALPLFTSLRAAVRAMAAALSDDAAAAVRRLELAITLLRRPNAPRLLAVGGPSGTGKSTLAWALAPRLSPPLGAVTLRSDEIRKRLAGVAPETPLPTSAYHPAAGEAVYRRMLADARRLLRAGRPAVLDAAFLEPGRRNAARALAAGLGVPFQGLWLEADPATRLSRVASRAADASDATPEVAATQTRREFGVVDWTSIDAGEGADATLRRARLALSIGAFDLPLRDAETGEAAGADKGPAQKGPADRGPADTGSGKDSK